MNRLDQQLKTFFRPTTLYGLANEDDWDSDLSPNERAAIRQAVPSRQREFAAGRSVAKRLLRSAGVDCSTIGVNSDRTPQWPKNWVGSISHSQDRCWVAVSRTLHCQGIGIDVEQLHTLDTDITDLVLTPGEQQRLEASQTPALSSLIFSCKESLHKALYPTTGIRLDFKDVQIAWTHDGQFSASIQHPRLPAQAFSGHYLTDHGFVYTAVEVPQR